MKRREYQLACDESILREYAGGVQRQLIVLPTGLGKTVQFAGLPDLLELQQPDVMLVVAHREELVTQAQEKIRRLNPGKWVEIEKAERRASPMADVVVGSIQSLQNARLDDFFARFHGRVRVAVFDESHHATSSTWMRVIDRLFRERSDALLLGFTATPSRADGVGLGAVFQKIVFHRDIRWAINEGYLVPPSAWRIDSSTSLDSVKTRAGDYAQNELARAVDDDKRNDLIVSAYLERTPGQKAIAFTVSVEHAYHLAQRFLAAGVPAAFASGETPKEQRREIIERFKAGDVRVLCNCALWTEGFDEPSAAVMIAGRPTKSTGLYTQMAGRVFRPLEEIAAQLGPDTTAAQRRALIAASAKPEAVILDVADHASRHSLVMAPVLWGLPPRLNIQGRKITEAAAAFERIEAKMPKEKREEIDSFDQLQHLAEKIDLFKAPEPDEMTSKTSDLRWFTLKEGEHYRLSLPNRVRAFDTAGREITDYFGRYRNVERRLQENGNRRPAAEDVHEAMGVARSENVRETLELRLNLLDQCEVTLFEGEVEQQIALIETMPAAMREADRWLGINRPSARRAVSRSAPWRLAQPTEEQVKLLRRLGVPDISMPETKGDASDLITKLLASKKKASA